MSECPTHRLNNQLTTNHFSENVPVFIYAGGVERGKGIKIEGMQWFVHPYYAEKTRNATLYDIALIKLDKIFPQNFINDENYFAINSICLPKNSFKSNENIEIGTYFGFGDYDGRKSQFLRKMTVFVDPASDWCFNKSVLCANVTGDRQKACYVSTGFISDPNHVLN